MKLKSLPFAVYGDASYRGDCPTEDIEQITFFNWLRRVYPATLGLLAIHPRNEQMLRNGQFVVMARHRAEGMSKGASDIIIPGAPTFVCELKRADHTKSTWQAGQIEYLSAARKSGAFACVALGHIAAIRAVTEWLMVADRAGIDRA